MNHSDNFENSLKWLADMRRRFEYFSMLSEHAIKTLDKAELLLLENKELRGALGNLYADLEKAPSTITYERDSLRTWIGELLAWKPVIIKD